MKEITQFATNEWLIVNQCFSVETVSRHPAEKQEFQDEKKGNSGIRNGLRESKTGFKRTRRGFHPRNNIFTTMLPNTEKHLIHGILTKAI